MLKDKGGKTTESKPKTRARTIITLVNMVDVNVTTRNNTNEEVFKDWNPKKNKSITSWEAKEKLKKPMVETIQQMQAVNPSLDLPTPLVGEWTISWARMRSLIKHLEPTKLQEVPSTFPSKNISMEEIFQDINKQMLETSCTLNLGQLIKITLDLK